MRANTNIILYNIYVKCYVCVCASARGRRALRFFRAKAPDDRYDFSPARSPVAVWSLVVRPPSHTLFIFTPYLSTLTVSLSSSSLRPRHQLWPASPQSSSAHRPTNVRENFIIIIILLIIMILPVVVSGEVTKQYATCTQACSQEFISVQIFFYYPSS